MANGEFKELIQYDQDILGRCKIIVAGKEIAMQFPPTISSDGKSAKWDTSDQGAYEPIHTFNGAESRTFEVKLKYVVVGGKWTPDFIAQVGRDIRAYFYNTVILNARGYPLVKIVLYDVVPRAGGKEMTCRLHRASTAYSGGLISNAANTYPLVTEHTLELQSCTRIGPIEGNILGALGPIGEFLVKVSSKTLSNSPAPEWY